MGHAVGNRHLTAEDKYFDPGLKTDHKKEPDYQLDQSREPRE